MAVLQTYTQSTVSTTNHTANYDLPLWADGDKTSWLEQVNDAMNKIDDGLVDAKSEALKVVGIAADAKKLAEETKAESDASAKIVAGYDDRLTAVEKKVEEHTDDITNLNKRCDQYDVELHSVKETQKKTTEDLATLADKVDKNKEETDATIATLNGTVVEHEGRITTLEEKTETLEAAQTSQGENITNLTTEVDNLSSRLASTDTIVAGHTNTINNLSQRVTQAETNISQTNTNVTNLSQNVETSLTEMDGKISALTEKVEAATGKTVLMYAKSDTLSSVTDTNGKAQFTGCTLAAYLYSDGTCDFTLSTGDTDPFVTDDGFTGSIGMFDLSDGVAEIMAKFKEKYPDIAIVRPMPQHQYPIIFYNTDSLPRIMNHCTISALFTASSTRMAMTTNYGLQLSALSGGTVTVRYGFVSGAHSYTMGSKQNFMIASVMVSGV